MRQCAIVALLALVAMASGAPGWVQPGRDGNDQGVWGFRDGIQVSLPRNRSPRGLINIYDEAICQTSHPLNFIAIEPVVHGTRGFSELEFSKLDHCAGKRLWSANIRDSQSSAAATAVAGVITTSGTVEILTVYIACEPFNNGAHVCIEVSFSSDAPREVGLRSFATPDSAPIEHCILTATMGNYARLRELHLREGLVTSAELWPTYTGNDFAPHVEFALQRLNRTRDGGMLVPATPDELNPAQSPAPGHWNFTGVRAAQYWRLPADEIAPETLARVNGRYVYWRSRNPLPGGIAFENFELQRNFRQGEISIFGVTTNTAELR